MGVPKRKASEGPGGAASPAGTTKRSRAEEFTGVRFKTQLKDAQGPGPGECERTPLSFGAVTVTATPPACGKSEAPAIERAGSPALLGP